MILEDKALHSLEKHVQKNESSVTAEKYSKLGAHYNHMGLAHYNVAKEYYRLVVVSNVFDELLNKSILSQSKAKAIDGREHNDSHLHKLIDYTCATYNVSLYTSSRGAACFYLKEKIDEIEKEMPKFAEYATIKANLEKARISIDKAIECNDKALDNYEWAAQKNDPAALCELGLLLCSGLTPGHSKANQLALDFFQQAGSKQFSRGKTLAQQLRVKNLMEQLNNEARALQSEFLQKDYSLYEPIRNIASSITRYCLRMERIDQISIMDLERVKHETQFAIGIVLPLVHKHSPIAERCLVFLKRILNCLIKIINATSGASYGFFNTSTKDEQKLEEFAEKLNALDTIQESIHEYKR